MNRAHVKLGGPRRGHFWIEIANGGPPDIRDVSDVQWQSFLLLSRGWIHRKLDLDSGFVDLLHAAGLQRENGRWKQTRPWCMWKVVQRLRDCLGANELIETGKGGLYRLSIVSL